MQSGVTIAGKYRLLNQIGRGGMGSVWLARYDLIDRDFAIKFLHPAAAQDPKGRERFLREARIPGRVRHPNVLEVVDVGVAPEIDGLPFLVMELLDGVPLDLAIRALGALPVRLALLIAAGVARALDAAHANGVLHRDLKPANVFLHRTATGHLVPKVVDFGIGKITDEAPAAHPDLELTRAGMVLGSPAYMSPEQAAGERELDGRSDLHAVGILLYWSLTARSPFKAKRFESLVAELVHPSRARVCDVRPDVPASVSALVSKAFASDRKKRFQTGAELEAAIQAELVALGPGPTLETRASVDDLFARLRAAGIELAERTTSTSRSLSPRPSLPPPTPTPSPSAASIASAAAPTASIGPASAFAASVAPPPPSPPRRKRVLAGVVATASVACIVLATLAGLAIRAGESRPAMLATRVEFGTSLPAPPVAEPLPAAYLARDTLAEVEPSPAASAIPETAADSAPPVAPTKPARFGWRAKSAGTTRPAAAASASPELTGLPETRY